MDIKLKKVSFAFFYNKPLGFWAFCVFMYQMRFRGRVEEGWTKSNIDVLLLWHFVFCIYMFFVVCFPSLSQFFTDPCASSPCLHGNCSRSSGGEEEGESAYLCECTEGYEGERCDQILLDLPPADWDPATPSAPEPATPVTSTTTATAQPQRPTTVPSTTTTTTPAPPTLQSWQPKPGQRLLVVPWEADRVRTLHVTMADLSSKCLRSSCCVLVCGFQVMEGLHCVSPELCELTSGTLTLSVEVPEETAVK